MAFGKKKDARDKIRYKDRKQRQQQAEGAGDVDQGVKHRKAVERRDAHVADPGLRRNRDQEAENRELLKQNMLRRAGKLRPR